MEELFLQDEREARYKRAEVPLLQIMLETGEGLFVWLAGIDCYKN